MPASKQTPAAPTPASPRSSTSKYTNKDGSKFIYVPKGTSPSDSSLPSTPTRANHHPSAPSPPPPPPVDSPAPVVNRKKQKRRQKAAAKAAAEQAANGHPSPAPPAHQSSDAPVADDQEDAVPSEDEVDFGGPSADPSYPTTNGNSASAGKSKKNKKKKKKQNAAESPLPTALEPRPSQPVATRGPGMSRDKIWSTSNHEERERIKEFWLGLGEDERKSLVKVEKDAVLKKMKEQQKHTCSCTVCGRKRTAIEEELEGLYDAYYLELEQFANQGEGPPLMASTTHDFPIQTSRRLPSGYAAQQPPSRGRIVEHVGDDDEDELEEVYSEDEVEDDEYSDDEPPEEYHNTHERDVADFLTFGNSLQVKGTQLLDILLSAYGNMDLGGILTVADDLLKNDGKRFIEMMEQLAERRMAREEDAREHFTRGVYGHPNGSYSNPHSHPPPEEEDYEDEEDEEDDYEDSQDEEYEDEEVYSNPSEMPPRFHTECCCQDPMTEEQRMEEGRRMFQIFAARMFEQRVLSAYKEKVAKERQQKLLEELEEESRQVEDQKAKKAKNAQKKKDKAAQKKQALAEEKARKEAERAAEEAARLEAEQKKLAEQKQKAEERRKQKEAQRKAEEDARLRREAERQRRIHEQREKQAEQERKAREAKDREKRLKEEQRLRDKEAREQREREAQERKEKQDRDKREKEARAARAQREAQEATEAREKARDEKGHKAQPTKRGQQHAAPVPAALPQLSTTNSTGFASPKIPVATPAIPKAPTPIRPRTVSQQPEPAPQSSTTTSQAPGPGQAQSPHSVTPNHASPGPIGQDRKVSGGNAIAMQHPAQPTSPQSSQSRPPSHTPPYQVPPMAMQPPPGLAHQRPPGFSSPMGHEPMFQLPYRPGPNMMVPPPGINGPAGRGFPPMHMPPPGFPLGASDQYPMPHGFPVPKDVPPLAHTRQGSTGYDGMALPAQPIGRPAPAPIGRPGSVSHGQARDEEEDAKQHLGSRALLGDDDTLPSTDLSLGSIRHPPPGLRGFASNSFVDSGFSVSHSPWGLPSAAAQAFPPPGFGNAAWGSPTMPTGFNVGSPAGLGSTRPAQSRHAALRLLLCQACQALGSTSSADGDGFIDVGTIKSQIESQSGDASIMEQELLNLCDTEGNSSNGGGTFETRRDTGSQGKHGIRWVPDLNNGLNAPHRAVGAPGEIGSPLVGQASLWSM
ncbi:Stress response protein nst1 [Purpureocillium takamizusanense]|uniref:Stress response protein NST1 n=1 Tax=Purpureocillium takamizusanense TaxID=2060973 RepID=A0A9Q8VBV9_9HYPO|nr:Stress response protein nst1 [Purpureocillium takamizusanense]UNI19279.1 Stress response protein nst1 [Purpureocillium takamizusanense]